jgi:hypothetical protein
MPVRTTRVTSIPVGVPRNSSIGTWNAGCSPRVISYIVPPAEQVRQIPIACSGGTDGVISPHATIFATVDPAKAEQTDEPRLTVGSP